MAARLFILIFFLMTALPIPSAIAKPAPGLSGTLSIIPGLGQVANGNPLEGIAWFTTIVGLTIFPNKNTRQIGWDLWFYNMYDAFRDAGGVNTTKYSVASNYIAVFNPFNLIDPIGAPIVGIGAIAGARRGYPALRNPVKPFVYGFVGLGEEGLFRGFLFPGFSDVFSSKWAGAITSSVLFALVHVTNGAADLQPAIMAQRFVFGMLFCWQTNRNKYDLRNGIFAHAWYDTLVDKSSNKTEPIYGLSLDIPF